MLKKFMFLLPVCASVISGCMSAPPLQEATGVENGAPNIFIKDVVQRVKCELSDAFYYKVEQRDFLWLASWTAHADLTLEINDNAGISPSGQYTKFQKTQLNKDAVNNQLAGSPAKPLAPTPTFLPMFTLGAGASLSGQAIRTETLSFTIALDELKRWRKDLDKREAGLPPEKKTCNFSSEMGITGNLGLKEWVDSAFFPVETGQLQAGIHPSQGGAKPSTTQGPKQAAATPKPKAELSIEQIAADTKAWQKSLTGLQSDTKASNTKIDDATKTLDTADANLKNRFQVLSDSKFGPVLAPYLKQRYEQFGNEYDQYTQSHKKSEQNCAKFKNDVDTALKDNQDLTALLKANTPIGEMKIPYNELSNKIDNILNNKTPADYAKAASRCADDLTLLADQATKNADSLPNQIDPPIDAVSHSLQFVVAYGANITPSWTLIQWKGPGLTQNFASASGTRTHTLNLALAPRTGGPAIGGDALRLINNQVIRGALGN